MISGCEHLLVSRIELVVHLLCMCHLRTNRVASATLFFGFQRRSASV